MARHRKPSGLAVTSKVNLAGSALTCPCHVCAFYDGADAQYQTLLPFLKEGIEAGDRIVSFVDAEMREARRKRLRDGGIDVEAAERYGQLEIMTWDQFYLRGGRFDADDMIGLVQELINTGRQLGFKRTRVWANMEWALQDAPGVERLAVYESRMNYVLPLYSEAVVCAYDVSRFPASVLEDVARAHPYLLADEFVQANPHYVPPDELVPELERKLS
jgi:hypothetical protein